VDVICAYLRMPYTPPDEQPPAEDAPAEAHTRYENRRQEQQVRLAAQNILSRNLRIDDQRHQRWWHRRPVPNWPGIRLDLTGALLVNFSLGQCQLYSSKFSTAQFTGVAYFEDGRVASTAVPDSGWPPGWTTRPAKPDNGEDPAFLYLTQVEEAAP
jgi:hypothetical protein